MHYFTGTVSSHRSASDNNSYHLMTVIIKSWLGNDDDKKIIQACMHDLHVVTCKSINIYVVATNSLVAVECTNFICWTIVWFSLADLTPVWTRLEFGEKAHMQLDWHIQMSCITFNCKFLWVCSVVRSCVLKSSLVKCWLIPSINISIDAWSTSQSILSWDSDGNWSTSWSTLDRQLVNSHSIVGRVLTNSYASIDTQWHVWKYY